MSSTNANTNEPDVEEGLATSSPTTSPPSAAAGFQPSNQAGVTPPAAASLSSFVASNRAFAYQDATLVNSPPRQPSSATATMPSHDVSAGLELNDATPRYPSPLEPRLATAAATMPSHGAVAGLELNGTEDVEPPLFEDGVDDTESTKPHPNQNSAASYRAGGIEHIEDGEAGPDDSSLLFTEALGQEVADKSRKVELIDDGDSPLPFDSTGHEDEGKNTQAALDGRKPAPMLRPSGGDSIRGPTGDDLGENEVLVQSRGAEAIRPEWLTQTNAIEDIDDEEEGGNDETLQDDDPIQEDTASGPVPEEDPSIPRIPMAYVVEEREEVQEPAEVYDGTPVQPRTPWWKQRRTKIFLFIFLCMAGLAIGFGVRSSKGPTADPVVIVVEQTSNYPSQSARPSGVPSATSSPTDGPSDVPTTQPSYQPTTIPSSAPSSCSETIMSNIQKIDLPLDDPQWLEIAVDGLDMVAVAQEGYRGGPVFIVFHRLVKGRWERGRTFQEDDLGDNYSVAISNGMAFVGFQDANARVGKVIVYQKTPQTGDWEKAEDPFVHDADATHDRFGRDVDIDGDLACLADWDNYVYLFRQDEAFLSR